MFNAIVSYVISRKLAVRDEIPRWKIIDVTVADVTTFPASAALTSCMLVANRYSRVHNSVHVASRALAYSRMPKAKRSLELNDMTVRDPVCATSSPHRSHETYILLFVQFIFNFRASASASLWRFLKLEILAGEVSLRSAVLHFSLFPRRCVQILS